MPASSASPSWRPRLLPRSRWAKASLLLIVVFALLRSVLWASVQPAWQAPDEDYHWLYINYLVVKDRVPDLQKGNYTQEYNVSVQLANQPGLSGRPHAVLEHLHGLSRQPIPPRPRPVLEAPLYYLPAAIVDKLLWGKVSLTRLDAIRYYSALLGAVTIYFAWLLAAQILAREWQQLAAAAIASLQMILAFSASTITNDVGVAATLTAVLAWCAWMLRGPPRARQGIGLGVLVGLALLMKATMLALVFVVPVFFLLWWRAFPRARRELLGTLASTVACAAVLAGPWYLYVRSVTNSWVGAANFSVATAVGGASGSAGLSVLQALGHMPSAVWLWIQQVYRNYWFTALFYQVSADNLWFWLPVIGGAIVLVGLVIFLVRTRRVTFAASGGPQRSVWLILFTALLLATVPMWIDSWGLVHGGGFLTSQGRFLTPAYPGLAVIAVLAVGELTARSRRLYPLATGAFVLAAFVLYWHSWIRWVLVDFFGPVGGHWRIELLKASFRAPSFVTSYSLAAVWAAALGAFAVAFVLTVVGESEGPLAGRARGVLSSLAAGSSALMPRRHSIGSTGSDG